MKLSGPVSKMHTCLEGRSVLYTLPVGNEKLSMNQLLGLQLSIRFTGQISCIKCGSKTKKSFAQGYCYRCFAAAPETEECVLRPELCRAHLGQARDMQYAKLNCLTGQYVYISVTSGAKVGVTRQKQLLTRWADQGAERAATIALAPNRYTAGLIEVILKEHFSDKTSWQKLLKYPAPKDIDIAAEAARACVILPESLRQHCLHQQIAAELEYPVLGYPAKITAANLDKDSCAGGKLCGIKGQYLIFEGGQVINIRKYGGYHIEMEW
jgi:hypothetical protein